MSGRVLEELPFTRRSRADSHGARRGRPAIFCRVRTYRNTTRGDSSADGLVACVELYVIILVLLSARRQDATNMRHVDPGNGAEGAELRDRKSVV